MFDPLCGWVFLSYMIFYVQKLGILLLLLVLRFGKLGTYHGSWGLNDIVKTQQQQLMAVWRGEGSSMNEK